MCFKLPHRYKNRNILWRMSNIAQQAILCVIRYIIVLNAHFPGLYPKGLSVHCTGLYLKVLSVHWAGQRPLCNAAILVVAIKNYWLIIMFVIGALRFYLHQMIYRGDGICHYETFWFWLILGMKWHFVLTSTHKHTIASTILIKISQCVSTDTTNTL